MKFKVTGNLDKITNAMNLADMQKVEEEGASEYCPACQVQVEIETKLDVTGLYNTCANCGEETTSNA